MERWDFPGNSVVSTLHYHPTRGGLNGKLRSYMLCGGVKKKKQWEEDILIPNLVAEVFQSA